jgi:hypothetical protein
MCRHVTCNWTTDLLEWCVLHRAVCVLCVIGLLHVLKHQIFGQFICLPSFDGRSCLAAEYQSQFPYRRTPNLQVLGIPPQTARYPSICILYIYISNLTERPVCRDVAEEGNIFPDDTSPLASVCERRLHTIFVRRKRVENLAGRKIVSVLSTARSASRIWWFVVVSLRSLAISTHFSFVKNSICWERVKKGGKPNICSEIYPHCTGKSNAQNWIPIVP